MLKVLRKHRNWLMMVIAILALPFVLYFSKSDTSQIHSDEVAKIYGRSFTRTDAQRYGRYYQLVTFLRVDLLDGLAPGAATDNRKGDTFVVNLIVLRHEAERLGIQPSDSEIVEAVKNFPELRSASGFDAAKYDEVEQRILPSLGFTDEQLREIARDELCLKRIREIVVSGVSMPESESKSNYEQMYGKNFVSVVRVHSADFFKEIKPTDEEIKKYYEAHKSELRTEEKRKVEFVRLALNEEQKKLKDKERIDALQKLADRGNDFSQALLEKGAEFHQVAAKLQLPVETTGEFTTSMPDPKLKADPQLNKVAFTLAPQEPNSDPIQSADGFAILHLAGIVEARPLTLDEAKQKIVDQIKNERSREMATAKGRKAAETLRNGLKGGQPLQSTLEQAGGLKPEKLEPFAAADEADAKNPPEKPKNEPADMMMIKNVSAQLQPGEVSEFVPWIDGGLIVLMEKREPPDPAKYQQTKATFEERYLKNAGEVVFMEWLRDRQRDAGLQGAKG
jgi:PPIC-type PPIASE domain/SurA N-terminal domain